MTSTVNGYHHSYNNSKKFYSNSIKSDSTGMTEEDEDFNTFTNSSSFQTSTTNSSPVNNKLDASEEQLLTLGFYSGPSLANSQLNGKIHSNFVRRSIIQSPSMKNFNQDVYFSSMNKSISTIYESSPVDSSTTNIETPTSQFGMTNSPSMRALESILNQKTHTAPIETIAESAADDEEEEEEVVYDAFEPPHRTIHNNQSEISVSSFHTAKSAGSDVVDLVEKEGLLSNKEADYEEETNDHHGLYSPGINSDPVKGLGLLSPQILGSKRYSTFEKQLPVTPTETSYQYRSMLNDDEDEKPAFKRTSSLQKPPLQNDRHIDSVPVRPDQQQQDKKTESHVDTENIKKNRRKSFTGLFKTKKSASSNDLLTTAAAATTNERPKKLETKSTPNVPLYSSRDSHVKSKSFSNFESLIKTNAEEPHLPKSKSKFFSAFKRKSAFAVPEKEVMVDTAEPAKAPLKEKPSTNTLVDEKVIREQDLTKGHNKRNSILVPSPVLENHKFEDNAKPDMFKDLSFSASMVSSINHNFSVMAESEADNDEFNSSFNSIKQSYSNNDDDDNTDVLSETKNSRDLLPRDISVGSLRLNFDDFHIDDYTAEVPTTSPRVKSNRGPAQRLQHHKTSSKIQNLLGEALFPKSLDINEVTSITTLERSRSMRSIRSGSGNSLRDSLLLDGMTVVRSPNSPIHEPNSTLLSSPSSILKRKSLDYDNDLQEFANMIDFGDDDEDEDDTEDFKLSFDLNPDDYDFDTFESYEMNEDTLTPVKSLKPLPSVPSHEDFEDEDEDLMKTESNEEEQPQGLQNPFDYPAYIKEEEEEENLVIPEIKAEEAEFDFEDDGFNPVKQESDNTLDEEDEENYDDDNFSVRIKQEDDFDEDFNDYDYNHSASDKSPSLHGYIPTQDEFDNSSRPFSMSARGLKGPKFGETNHLVASSSTLHSMYMALPATDSSQYLQTSPSRLNLNERILKSYYNNNVSKKVAFSSRIILFDTYHEEEYDRHPEIATCNQLTPLLAQQIKEELNLLKNEMDVHESSKCYTQYY